MSPDLKAPFATTEPSLMHLPAKNESKTRLTLQRDIPTLREPKTGQM